MTETYHDLQAMGEVADVHEYYLKLARLADHPELFSRTESLEEVIQRQLRRVQTFLGIPNLTQEDRQRIDEIKRLLGTED